MHVHFGVGAQPVADLDPFVRGVVVHHQVQFAVGVGAGDLAQEARELLVAVSGLAGRGDLSGGDVQRREQGGGAVADVVRQRHSHPPAISTPGNPSAVSSTIRTRRANPAGTFEERTQPSSRRRSPSRRPNGAARIPRYPAPDHKATYDATH